MSDPAPAAASGHPVVQSVEPREDWSCDHDAEVMLAGPALADPTSRPEGQRCPGPRVPLDWRDRVHR